MRRMSGYFAAILTLLILVPGLSADVCSNTTDCTFNFDASNGSVDTLASYGTVELKLIGSNIEFLINLKSGFHLIQTGNRPGTFGFNDTLSTNDNLTYVYSDSTDYSGGNGSGQVDNFDFFGDFSATAGTTAPRPGARTAGVGSLNITVSRPGGFTDVNQLVGLSKIPPGERAYFVADVFQTGCAAPNAPSCTGLIGVTGGAVQVAPEPTSYGVLLAGFGAIAFVIQRRERRRKNSVLAE